MVVITPTLVTLSHLSYVWKKNKTSRIFERISVFNPCQKEIDVDFIQRVFVDFVIQRCFDFFVRTIFLVQNVALLDYI